MALTTMANGVALYPCHFCGDKSKIEFFIQIYHFLRAVISSDVVKLNCPEILFCPSSHAVVLRTLIFRGILDEPNYHLKSSQVDVE